MLRIFYYFFLLFDHFHFYSCIVFSIFYYCHFLIGISSKLHRLLFILCQSGKKTHVLYFLQPTLLTLLFCLKRIFLMETSRTEEKKPYCKKTRTKKHRTKKKLKLKEMTLRYVDSLRV